MNNRDYFESLKDTHKTKVSSNFVIGLEGEIREFFYDESGAAPKGKGGLGRLFRG